jgi:hypothetical protein
MNKKEVSTFINEILENGKQIVLDGNDIRIEPTDPNADSKDITILNENSCDVRAILAEKPDNITPIKVTESPKLEANTSNYQVPSQPKVEGGNPFTLCKPELVLTVIDVISKDQNIINVDSVLDAFELHIIQNDFWDLATSILSDAYLRGIVPTKSTFLSALKGLFTGNYVRISN